MTNPEKSTPKDFWRNSKIAVIGGGSFGTVLANLAAKNCQEVRLWVRSEESARAINATRINSRYLPNYSLNSNVAALSDLDRVFEGGLDAVIWCLPSNSCREQAKRLAPYLKGNEIVLHATKGVEPGTLKRISELLCEELPTRRIGVLSGPNLAEEIAAGKPAATTVASVFTEVAQAGELLLAGEQFRIYRENDVIGVELAGTLKNILAIAAGALDALQLGWNARAMLITRGLAEIVRFGVAMGAKESTFLSLAGVGDLLATCSSPLSRNYQVGYRLAQGEKLSQILDDLEATAEGVTTTNSVWKYAQLHGIEMPITESVNALLTHRKEIAEILQDLFEKPQPR